MNARQIVYKVQCVTWSRALELCKIKVEPGRGLATPGNHALATFRALPKYRDDFAKVLRGMVALSIKMDRFNQRNLNQ